MKIVRYVVSAGGFAFKVGALAIGLSWLVVLLQGHGARPAGAPEESRSAFEAGPAADPIIVTMKPAEGRSFSFYSLRDEEGNELSRVTYSRGGLVVTLGEAYPVRSSLAARADGSGEFRSTQDGIHYEFYLRPGGTSGLQISDDFRGSLGGLGVTRDGRIVHDPSALD